MTNKERVVAAIQFQKTDYIPHSVGFTDEMYDKVKRELGSEYFSLINNHITAVDLNKPQIEVKAGFYQDEYGVVWNKTGADKDIGMPERYLDAEEVEDYKFPIVDKNFVQKQCEKLMKEDESNLRIACIGFSMYERLWTLLGIEESLCNMIVEPELIHDILQKICNRNLEILDIALEYELDGIYFGDDWGQQQGMIMGPQKWREFIKPYVSQMYNKVKEKKKWIIQHSCGDIREIMEDLYEMGLNVYQTFQPEIYGLDYRKELFGKIAIWGGISTQYDLPFKTPEEIRVITRQTMDYFRDTGGLIVSPTHAVPGDVPVENIKAMFDVILGDEADGSRENKI